MNCIFEKSKYYRNATVSAQQIAQPLGYNFLRGQKKSFNQYNNHNQKVLKISNYNFNNNKIKQKYKYTLDKATAQILSNRKSTTYDLDSILQLTSAQRKNILTGMIDFLNKQIDKETFYNFKQMFAPKFRQSQESKIQASMLLIASLFSNIPKDHLFQIQNYSLTKYFLFFQAQNINQVNYLYRLFNVQLLQYQIEGIFSSPNIQKCPKQYKSILNFEQPTLQQVKDVKYVEKKIQQINSFGKKQDDFYCGIHFFGGIANKFQVKQSQFTKYEDYFKQQLEYLPYLQYYITLMTGVLAEGHSALIPLRGTFRFKTNQFVFILKIMFQGKINLIKPIGSNIFTNQKYIYCQDFNRQIGLKVNKHLISNYNLLNQEVEQRLLLNPKAMYKQEFEINISKFNDTIINKGLKYYFKDYQNNKNNSQFFTVIYPPRDKFIEKMQKQLKYDQKLTNYAKNLIPQEIKEESQDQFKQADNIANNQNPNHQNQKQEQRPGRLKPIRRQKVQIDEKQADHQLLNFTLPPVTNLSIQYKRPRQNQEKQKEGSKHKAEKDHRHKIHKQKQKQKSEPQKKEQSALQILQRLQAEKANKKKNKSKPKY